jgi:hypothetical protein
MTSSKSIARSLCQPMAALGAYSLTKTCSKTCSKTLGSMAAKDPALCRIGNGNSGIADDERNSALLKSYRQPNETTRRLSRSRETRIP